MDTPEGRVIESYADGTASWLLRHIRFDLKDPQNSCLNWSWSADELPVVNASETTLAGDDFAARIYVFGSLEDGTHFGFNYVWSTQMHAGAVWKSPWTDNHLMSLRQGANPTGQMLHESRPLLDDISRAYGRTPLAIRSIALMTDSEQTGSVAKARFGPVEVGACTPAIS